MNDPEFAALFDLDDEDDEDDSPPRLAGPTKGKKKRSK